MSPKKRSSKQDLHLVDVDVVPLEPEPAETIANIGTMTTVPGRQIVSPRFWWRQLAFSLTVFVGIASLWWIYPLALAGVNAGVERYVSWLNLALWSWAVLEAAQALATIEVNHALGQHVFRKGEGFLRELRSGQGQRIPLDDLSVRFLPANPARPAITRLFEHIVEEAKDRQFNFSGNVVRVYREESVARLARVERLQQLTLRMGILGTFIGLGMAMHQVPAGLEKLLPEVLPTQSVAGSSALAESRNAFLGLANNLVSALGDAFGTSISGLACAASIWAIVHVVRRRQYEYFSVMDRAAEVVTSLARNALNVNEFHEHFKQLIRQLDELKIQLYDRVGSLSEGVAALDGKVTVQTVAIEAGLQKLKDGGRELDEFLRKLSDNQGHVLTHLQQLFEKAELRTVFARLEAAIEQAGKNLGGRLETKANALIDQALPFQNGLGELNKHIETSVKTLERLEGSLQGINTGLQTLRPPPPFGGTDPQNPSALSRARFVSLISAAGVCGSVVTLIVESVIR